jgi:Icc-related predicted phosphoesterase
MRLWVLSDLHLELTRGWDFPAPGERPDYDVMVIAGDLIPRAERGVAWLRKNVPDRPVVYVPGNHEFYGCDIDRTIDKARAEAVDGNVHILQNNSVTISGATFVGATLWTDFGLFGDPQRAMSIAGDVMNDYRKIRTSNYERRLRPEHTLARHIQSREFISQELSRPITGPRIVVTHHGPHPSAVRGGLQTEIVSAAYASDLTQVITAGTPDVWVYGHTHESEDLWIGSTRIVSNAKGYGPWLPSQLRWDNPSFNPRMIITSVPTLIEKIQLVRIGVG